MDAAAAGRSFMGPPFGKRTCRLLLVFVAILLAAAAAALGPVDAARHNAARHRHNNNNNFNRQNRLSGSSRQVVDPLDPFTFFPREFYEDFARRDPAKLERVQALSDFVLEPSAYDPARCNNLWASDQVAAFGCKFGPELEDAPPMTKGVLTDRINDVASFLVTLSVRKDDRLSGSASSFTNCTGWLVDPEIVITYAACVGPLLEFEVTRSIRVRQAHLPPGAGNDATTWATRLCYSHKLYWPHSRANDYELAVVRLEKPLTRDPSAAIVHEPLGACMTRQQNVSSPIQPACLLMSVCDSGRPSTERKLAHFVRSTPVRLVRDTSKCRNNYVHPDYRSRVNDRPPYQTTCWESAGQEGVNVSGNLCPRELSRALFCWPDGCPASPVNPLAPPTSALTGLAPMHYEPVTSAKSVLFEGGILGKDTPATVTTFADFRLAHEQLKDMLVDVRVHTHGGSHRSLCRNLGRPPAGGATAAAAAEPTLNYVRGLKVSNAGYQRASKYAWGSARASEVDIDNLPGGLPGAYACDQCWNGAELMSNWSFVCDPPRVRHPEREECFIDRAAQLPFMAELRVFKKFLNWTTSTTGSGATSGQDDPEKAPGVVHSQLCRAWLLSKDFVVTQSECLAPENHFDRVLSVEVHFPKPPANATPPRADTAALLKEWPQDREAKVACWSREASPYSWGHLGELAMVRFEPPIKYLGNLLRPACVFVGEDGSNQENVNVLQECTRVAQCHKPIDLATFKGQWTEWTERASTPVRRSLCSFPHRANPTAEDDKWFSNAHLTRHWACWNGNRTLPGVPKCPGVPREEQLYVTLCKMGCRELSTPTQATSYLAALDSPSRATRLPNVPYAPTDFDELRPPSDSVPEGLGAIDLSLAKRPLQELFLAAHADNTGTRGAVCQLLKTGDKSRRRRGPGFAKSQHHHHHQRGRGARRPHHRGG